MWARIFAIVCAFHVCFATISPCGRILNNFPRLRFNSALRSSKIRDMEWEGGDRFRFADQDVNCLPPNTTFKQENIIATKIANYMGTVIILTPKFREGVVSSMYSYDTKLGLSDPIFSPYPDVTDHKPNDCDSIQNAVDFYQDDNDLLWVLDTGVVETLGCPKSICSPKVICICMSEKRVVTQFDLSEFVTSKSALDNIVVDYNPNGHPFMYISDSGSNQLFIYDVENKKGNRIPLPSDMKSTTDDLLYLMLLKRSDKHSELYISYMDNQFIYSIETTGLMNNCGKAYMTKITQKSGKIIFLGTDKKQNIYYSYLDERDVYIWNTHKTNELDCSKIIYTSQKGLDPMSVMVEDGTNRLKLMEVAFEDFMAQKCGVGAVHKLKEIGRV